MAAYDRTYTGGLTPAGSVPTLTATRYLSNQASQVLTFAGALTRTRQRVVSGVLSFAGAVQRMSTTGNVFWNDLLLVGRVLASLGGEGGSYRKGATAPSGAPSTVKIVRYLANQASQVLSFSGRVLTGSVGEEGSDRKGNLWITGYLRDMVSTVKRTGTLTMTGIVASYQSGGTAIAKSVSGALNLAGSIYEILIQVQHELYKGVVLTFSGRVAKILKEPKRTLSGTLTFEKYCTWQWNPYTGIQYVRTIVGAITFAGALSYLRGTFKEGTLTVTGLLTRSSSVFKSVGSIFLSCTGTVIGSWAPIDMRGGILSFAGAISSKVPFKSFAGAMAISGNLTRTFTITRKQMGTLTALNEIERTKELLYYGIINP